MSGSSKRGLGNLRRSTLVSTHGPGAIVDYRAGGAPISAVTLGLDEWNRKDTRKLIEPTLERLLNTSELREPPVSITDRRGDQAVQPSLPAVRFPDWLECPVCRRLKRARKWTDRANSVALTCGRCSELGDPVSVIPARLVSTCERGHLSDFPWIEWIEHADDCKRSGDLELKSKGAGLRGLFVNCLECGKGRSLNNALTSQVAGVRPCPGERPWLGADATEPGCPSTPRTLQRGASNTYFSASVSALTIPPWTDSFKETIVEQGYWDWIQEAILELEETGDEAAYTKDLRRIAKRVAADNDHDPDAAERHLGRINTLIAEYKDLPQGQDSESLNRLRHDEWHQFMLGDSEREKDSTFMAHDVEVPQSLSRCISTIVRVPRLREVTALTGFTRLRPPDGSSDQILCNLSQRARWYPASETLGEGIFIALNEQSLATWESAPEVLTRASELHGSWVQQWQARNGAASEAPVSISPRMLVVHGLAHALMSELALECGYSAASLRERLYVSSANESGPMAGLLIYTASADSDGTLGGLEREGQADRIEGTIHRALDALRWCSSDPLCMSGIITTTDALNGAACHSCLFAPETSCETSNRFLDRGLMIGVPPTPSNEKIEGFFDGRTGTPNI